MRFFNQSDVDATWRCYYEKSAVIDGYGNISANGGTSSFDPPDASGRYTVVFDVPSKEAKGLPRTLSSGHNKVSADEVVSLMGSKGAYEVVVGQGYQA
jgi:hypothetical protein